jgi:hypothetical protein
MQEVYRQFETLLEDKRSMPCGDNALTPRQGASSGLVDGKSGLQLWTVAVNMSDETIFTPGLLVRQTGAWKVIRQVVLVKRKQQVSKCYTVLWTGRVLVNSAVRHQVS